MKTFYILISIILIINFNIFILLEDLKERLKTFKKQLKAIHLEVIESNEILNNVGLE